MSNEINKRCPVCGQAPGPYRFGACSIGCDMTMGDEEPLDETLFAVALVLAVVAVLVIGLLVAVGVIR